MIEYHIQTLPDDIDKGSPHKYVNGVILTKVPYTSEFHPHTTSIASEAIRGNKACLRWLVENIEEDGSYLHHFTLPFYNFKTPWVGGLAQGLAISALVNAYKRDNNQIYLQTANRAFSALKKHCWQDGWITEYPNVKTILNGFIYALFGVYDLSTTGHKGATHLWNQGIKTLAHNISGYDLGFWSCYSLESSVPATVFYHDIHIDQLAVLYQLTKIYKFAHYHLKFKEYKKSRFCIAKSKIKRVLSSCRDAGIINRYIQRQNWLKTMFSMQKPSGYAEQRVF